MDEREFQQYVDRAKAADQRFWDQVRSLTRLQKKNQRSLAKLNRSIRDLHRDLQSMSAPPPVETPR